MGEFSGDEFGVYLFAKTFGLNFEPIPRSLRPFATKIQHGKDSMTDRRTDISKVGEGA